MTLLPLALLLPAVLLPGERLPGVEVLWQGVQHAYPQQGPARIPAGQDVWLSVLVTFADGTCAVRLGGYRDAQGALHVCERMEDTLNDFHAVWLRVESSGERHGRSARGEGAPLPYVDTPWASMAAGKRVLADGRPSWARHDADSVDTPAGTMRFSVRIEEWDGRVVGQSAGAADPAAAFTLRLRAYEDLVGVVEELSFVPAADAPRGAPPAQHETERALCVDAVTPILYAARRLGLPVGYAGVQELAPFLDAVKGPVRRGDLVTRDGVLALLAEDRGKRGVLDGPDVLVWSQDGPVRRVTVDHLPGAGTFHVQRLRLPRTPGETPSH